MNIFKMKRLEIRIPEDEKNHAQAVAKELDISLSELTRINLKNSTVPDRKTQKAILKAMVDLTGELNKIGKNINQISKALNQINLDYKLPENEVEEFNLLMSHYLKKRNDLSLTLEKLMS